MAAFIGMGVSAEHLMAASVMAAPAALASSKLSFPETEESKTARGTEFEIPRGDADNVLQAAANGASESIPLMLNVGAMLIAFLSLLECINQILHSLGSCFGVPQLSVDWITQYLFLPFAYLLGAQGDDALKVRGGFCFLCRPLRSKTQASSPPTDMAAGVCVTLSLVSLNLERGP